MTPQLRYLVEVRRRFLRDPTKWTRWTRYLAYSDLADAERCCSFQGKWEEIDGVPYETRIIDRVPPPALPITRDMIDAYLAERGWLPNEPGNLNYLYHPEYCSDCTEEHHWYEALAEQFDAEEAAAVRYNRTQ